MVTVSEAWQHILEVLPDFGSETVALEDACGRVLRQTVTAERDQPPFDRVMMDGIAIRHTGARRFRLQATQQAGDAPITLSSDEHCIEIMTGAVLPPGTDTVVPVERIAVADGHAELEADYEPERGQFVHRRGSDHPEGALLLAPGSLIGGPEAAVLASQGLARVAVGRHPAVAVVSTGNELVGPERALQPQEIRASNGPAMLAVLRHNGFAGCRDIHLRDEPAAMRNQLGGLLEEHRVLILSGGVSKGKADYVPGILSELGVEVVFHGVSQRPGKPMWFGVRDDRLVFALPGNPVSTLVCFRRYVVPALFGAAGLAPATPETAILSAEYRFRPSLTCFLPAHVRTDDGGRLMAAPSPTNTSGDFTTLAGTSGFVELDRERENFPAGTPVPFYRWQAG
ncbi:MAG: molybdopterin molybdotransferase MoeA [Gammaproteobacteria bacterium]|jgi:molybdopterin molybdotransferase